MIVVVMGVSGSGKSTVGKALAAELEWEFIEGDDYHPDANVEKMSAGIPLTDEDRRPWLAGLHQVISGRTNAVLACSALRADYRDQLRGDRSDVRFVYLEGAAGVIRERMRERDGHFMPPELLTSQLETLEPPADAVVVSIELSLEEKVRLICEGLPK